MSNAGQIYGLIPAVMKDIGVIGKGRKNQQQNYAFRGIDDMYNAVQPVLVKHGVFVCPCVQDQRREDRQTKSGGNLIYTVLTVKHTFYAPDGSSVEVVTVGEAMDSGDKSANKAMSAAMKYALIEVFSIPTEGDNDTENTSHEVTATQQPRREHSENLKDLLDLLKVVKLPEGTVERWFASAKVSKWDDMPEDKIKKCLDYVGRRVPTPTAA